MVVRYKKIYENILVMPWIIIHAKFGEDIIPNQSLIPTVQFF